MKVVLTFLLCVTLSCAYYNTFYNARKFYAEAQKSKGGKDASLDKCIEKCAKVIEYHPGSKWVDDAILLMGKCFYEKKNYSRARTKFDELLTYFPNSPLVDEARLFLGRCHLSQGDYALAVVTLAELKGTAFACDALFFMAEALYATEDYEAAAGAYQNLLESCPKTAYREPSLENLAAALLSMEEYSTAIELYHSLLRGRLSEEERLEVSLKIADAYLNLGEAQQALDILLEIDRQVKGDQSKAQIQLKASDCHRMLGELDLALSSLQQVLELSPKSEMSARSYYSQGEIFEDEYLDFEKAKEAYESVVSEYKAAEVSKDAERKITTFNKIEKYRNELLEGTAENQAETQFLLAELYLLDLEKEDIALEEYQKVVTEFADSNYTPKAIYAIAWIHLNLKSDSQTAEGYFRQLIDQHSETKYANMARKNLRSDDEPKQ
jgi:TolA-binding protein